MPRGYPANTKAAPVATVVPMEPAPMIFIEPGLDGSIRLNAYGLDGGEIVEVLRRSLLHLVASQAGVQVISVDVPMRAAVVAHHAAPAKPKPAKPSSNGRHYAREMKRDVALAEFDEADE